MRNKNSSGGNGVIKELSRLIGTLMLIAAFVSILSTDVWAQGRACADITESTVDEVRIVNVSGKPNDTVWVPVYVSTDSIMSGFRMLINWDSSKVDPVAIFDPVDGISRVVTQLTGRFVQTDQFGDTTTNFFSQLSLDPIDSGSIIAGYNLSVTPDSTVSTTPPGDGVIFRMAFTLKASMPHNDSALIEWYEIQPVIFVPPDPPILLDCRRTEISVDYNNTGIPFTLFPTTTNGFIVADTAPGPQINNFEASPPTITQGSSTIIQYDVTNVDSLAVNGPGVSFSTTTNFVGSIANVAPSSTSNYTLSAFNVFEQTDSTITITVTADTIIVDPNAPAISFPNGSVHVIEQGQTVNFNVTATDPDPGDIVTLNALNLPSNAIFNTVVGTNTVTGDFSFTPDISQEGTFVIQFRAEDDNNNVSTASASVTVEALEFDRLFSTSATGQSPIGGLSGTPDLIFPINMVSSQTVYGIQFDVIYDPNAISIDSVVRTPRIQDFTIYEDIGAIPGQFRVLAFGLSNDTVVVDTNGTAVMNAYVTIDSNAVAWSEYIVQLTNGFESVNPDPNFPSIQMVTEGGLVQVDNPGDVNLDQRIDVADLVSIVSFVIGNFGFTTRQFEVADVIRNDTINVFDLVGTVNAIFGIPLSPIPPPPISSEPAVIALEYNDIFPGQSDIMVVKSDLPERVAAAELDLAYDPSVMALGIPQLTDDASNLSLQYKFDSKGGLKVLLYFNSPIDTDEQLQPGNVDMVKIPIFASRYVEVGNTNQLKLSNALLSTSSAASIAVEGFNDEPLLPESFELFQNYPNPFNPTTMIEFTIGLAQDGSGVQRANLDIFNILGQRVISLVDEDLPSGHYQVEWDSRNSGGARVATGVYFYRLQVGSEHQTKKMLLLK